MKNRYVYLDGIRGLAAIAVLTRHTSHYWNLSFFRSYLAVDVFFILSGFVIASAYDRKVETGTLSGLGFMKIRYARLYPAFILSLALSSAAVFGKTLYLGHGASGGVWLQLLASIVLAAVFLPSWVSGNESLFPMNGAYWSLFDELLINAIYARIRPRLGQRPLLMIALAAGALLGAAIYREGLLGGGSTWSLMSLAFGLTRSCFGIFAGLCLYRHRERLQAMLPRALPAWTSLIVVSAILLSPSAGRFDGLLDAAAIFIAFPVLLLVAARGAETRRTRFLAVLGEASYPLYVFHIPVGQMLFFVFGNRVPAHAPYSGLALLALLLAVSIGFARRCESQMKAAILRWLRSTPTPPLLTDEAGASGPR
jgi:peptidoglycan/LPS O-acetylase OafA/YrhL